MSCRVDILIQLICANFLEHSRQQVLNDTSCYYISLSSQKSSYKGKSVALLSSPTSEFELYCTASLPGTCPCWRTGRLIGCNFTYPYLPMQLLKFGPWQKLCSTSTRAHAELSFSGGAGGVRINCSTPRAPKQCSRG